MEGMDAETASRLAALNAKPWRGACPWCPFTLWCTDTEKKAHELVMKHITEEHAVSPYVWRDH